MNIEFRNQSASKHNISQYTISSANTWEYKTITFTGDTASGFANSNALGAYLIHWGKSGSSFNTGTAPTNGWVNLSATNFAAGATLDYISGVGRYIEFTGIQLEVGDTATPFEHRSYGDELAKCHRYYVESNWVGTQVVDANNTDRNLIPSPPQPMRTNPTITVFNPSTGTANQGYAFSSGATATISSIGGFNSLNIFQVGTGAYLQSNNTNRYTSFLMKMDAEL